MAPPAFPAVALFPRAGGVCLCLRMRDATRIREPAGCALRGASTSTQIGLNTESLMRHRGRDEEEETDV